MTGTLGLDAAGTCPELLVGGYIVIAMVAGDTDVVRQTDASRPSDGDVASESRSRHIWRRPNLRFTAGTIVLPKVTFLCRTH